MHLKGRAKYEDHVRLYGYPGLFSVSHTSSRYHDFYATPIDAEGLPRASGFPHTDSGIVEINGKPCPLLSAPLTPPASDYPHEPLFDYDDGPQSLGASALDAWRKQHAPGVYTDDGRPAPYLCITPDDNDRLTLHGF